VLSGRGAEFAGNFLGILGAFVLAACAALDKKLTSHDFFTFCNSYHCLNFSPRNPQRFHKLLSAFPQVIHSLSTGLQKFSTGCTKASVFAAAIDQLGTIGFKERKPPELHDVM